MEGEEQIPEVHFSPVKKRAGEQRDGEQAHDGNSPLSRRGEEKCFAGPQETTFSSVKFRVKCTTCKK